MAGKKSNNGTNTHTTHSKPHTKNPRDLSPDNQMDNLKTLNHLLLQETMEKRSQIDNLKAKMQDLSDARSIASDLELEICLIVLSCSLSEQERKVESLQEKLGSVSRENDEMKKVLEGVVSERDLMRNEVDLRRREVAELERENGEIRERLGHLVVERDEMERKGMKSEEAYDSLVVLMEDAEKEREEIESMRTKLDGKVGKISLLEDEGRRHLEARSRLEVEVRDLKDALGLVKGEEEGLRVMVVELDKMNEEARKEIDRMGVNISVLEKEKEEKKGLEVKIGELESKLDETIEKVREIGGEKDKVEKVRVRQEVEILELKKVVEKLHSEVMKLKEKCRDYSGKNTQLQDERYGLMRECGELEKMMVEKEKGFAADVEEISRRMNDLVVQMGEISAMKDEAENVKAKQEVEINVLKKEVEQLSSNASELQGMCRDYVEKNTRLEGERDSVKRELTVKREEASELQSQVEKLKKHRDESLEKIKKLSESLETLASEKEEGKRHIETMVEEKASLEKKMRSAEVISDKALALLKRTTEVLNEPEKAHENGVVDHEEIHPFAEALEGIKGAFWSRVAKIEEMNREVEGLKKEVNDEKNKKRGLLMWLYPATTTVLAAISLAYAAGVR